MGENSLKSAANPSRMSQSYERVCNSTRLGKGKSGSCEREKCFLGICCIKNNNPQIIFTINPLGHFILPKYLLDFCTQPPSSNNKWLQIGRNVANLHYTHRTFTVNPQPLSTSQPCGYPNLWLPGHQINRKPDLLTQHNRHVCFSSIQEPLE